MSDLFGRSRCVPESGISSTEYEPGCSPAALLSYRIEALSLAEPDLCLFGCVYAVCVLPGVLRNPGQLLSTQRPDPASAWLVLSWRY